MTSVEHRRASSVLSGDLREAAPYLSGLARALMERAAAAIDAQADLLAVTVPVADHALVVERLAAHHELTTGRCHVCGWEHPSIIAERRRFVWRQR